MRSVKSKAVWALIALNVVLVATLVGQWLRPNAAVAAGEPRVSEYIMLPGDVVGGNTAVVYIIDTNNGMLGSRTYQGGKIIDGPPIDLRRVFGSAGAGGGGPKRR